MYLKIVSSIVVLCGFSFLGFYYAYKPLYRKNDLCELKRGLLSLVSEIKFLSNLNEAILNIEKNLNNPIKTLFTNFRQNIQQKRGENLSTLWQDALNKSKNQTYFTKEDIENINVVGKIIGSLDKDFSIDALNIVIQYIDGTIKIIDKEKTKTFKMYQSLGVLSGLMIVILLI